MVSGDEDVRGLAPGGLRYAVQYELIRPSRGSRVRTLLVEAENRGNPVFLGALYPDGAASGPPASATYRRSVSSFLRSERLAYARIQWQTGIAPDVPVTAQGVGEVIVRDLGRFLARRYPRRALVGVSQGAFFVDTFLAEGFNAAPGGGRRIRARAHGRRQRQLDGDQQARRRRAPGRLPARPTAARSPTAGSCAGPVPTRCSSTWPTTPTSTGCAPG